MKQQIEEAMASAESYAVAYAEAFNRFQAASAAWQAIVLRDVLSGKTPDDAWWAALASPEGKDAFDLCRIAEVDKMRIGFEYEAQILRAKSLIALKEEM